MTITIIVNFECPLLLVQKEHACDIRFFSDITQTKQFYIDSKYFAFYSEKTPTERNLSAAPIITTAKNSTLSILYTIPLGYGEPNSIKDE
jgi:hypothetical protein